MKNQAITLVLAITLAGSATRAGADLVTLGVAGDFAVLSGTTVTNTGPSVIRGGHVGTSPGTAIVGFAPGMIEAPYAIQAGNALAAQAQADLGRAYDAVTALAPKADLTGQDLGGLVLTAGVYDFASSAQLTGVLTLDARGDPDAQFVFRIGSTLTTAEASSVVILNGGAVAAGQILWQVGSSATLGTATMFRGHILAQASITLNRGASLADGGALARTGAVTLDTNRISNLAAVPEPSSLLLVLAGGAAVGLRSRRGRGLRLVNA